MEMPGCKRKSDEDTWLVCQTKKSKSNPNSQSVYDSTLAKLRVGTRKYFSPGFSNTNQQLALLPSSQNDLILNIAPSQEINDLYPGKICSDCRVLGDIRRRFVDKCNFCDKPACHLSSCSSCREDFCFSCYVKRYDDPTSDSYICISCLQ